MSSLRNQVILFFIVGAVPTALEQDAITRLEDQAAVVRVRTLTQDTTFGGKPEICDGIAILDESLIPTEYGDTDDFPIVTPVAIGTGVTVEHDDVIPLLRSAGTKQVETATCAGTCTVQGTVIATVTAACMGADSPRAISFVVNAGDTAANWATKARAALAADAIINEHFAVSGATVAIILTADVPAANDGTLNIGLAAGTATGPTTAASSANTTAGVAPTVLDTGKAVVAGGAIQGVLQDTAATTKLLSHGVAVPDVTVTGIGTTATPTIVAGVLTAIALS